MWNYARYCFCILVCIYNVIVYALLLCSISPRSASHLKVPWLCVVVSSQSGQELYEAVATSYQQCTSVSQVTGSTTTAVTAVLVTSGARTARRSTIECRTTGTCCATIIRSYIVSFCRLSCVAPAHFLFVCFLRYIWCCRARTR